MQDRPHDEGIQPAANPLRIRESRPEARNPGGEGPAFQVEFTLSIEEAMALNDNAPRFRLTTPTQKRSLSTNLVVLGFGLLIVGVSLANNLGLIPGWVKTALPSLGWMFLGAVLGLVTGVILWNRTSRAAMRRFLENDPSLFVTHRVTLTPEAATCVMGALSRKMLWEGVMDVMETDSYLFIVYSPGHFFFVPRHAFADRKEFERFADAAERYFEASGAPKTADASIRTSVRE